MNRAEILDAAKKCVCGQRVQDYGKPEHNFQTIADFWNDYLDAAHPELNLKSVAECVEVPAIITSKDVAVMMGLLKVARIATGSNPDSFVDLAGYAACAGEIATQSEDAETVCVRNIQGEEFEVKVRDLMERVEDDRK